MLPGLTEILSRFGAPVAIVELPDVGASHRFGLREIDGRPWSVDVQSVRADLPVALARTIRDDVTDPHDLCASTLTGFVASAASKHEVERTTRRTIDIAGEPRTLTALEYRDHTGMVTEIAGNTVIVIMPADHVEQARIGLLA
ncbi:hypothetical protein EV193_101679 [Herbihabitans rhizosphaerae]|uniref:Uncharacterized protein n=1 Tax=Herbihabitans rhizosphaerae TaxID=1872711 RepID=A0A4Q7L7D3_9PSEU|nr:hypothetical protein [Herbihabitans rhizosphaerae]RZS44800.1 hypothetical protein EV193_101679 [Herbihabitans rhizosphaerae]